MSLVITLNVREGIVMASDSRLTLNNTNKEGQIILAVGQSDSNYKTFLTANGIGISTFGQADINGIPISGYIESFIREKINASSSPITVDKAAKLLLDYFRSFTPIPNTLFHVAGYIETTIAEQQIWSLNIAKNELIKLNSSYESNIGGESDILGRIFSNVAQINESMNVVNVFPSFGIPFHFFTLQDAIDFSIFAIRTTIDVLKFQPRAKTVGGPIDVLVIKPDNAFWVQHKELKGE